jgi:hypothetical protein
MRAPLRVRDALLVAFVLGAVAGEVASVVVPVYASRNSSGTYSLPAGNPVVAGTTISATTHNNTNSDIATELTDSLSRSGKGAMLAPLQGYDGTVSLPGYTFGSDADTGLYRIGANNPAMSAGNTKVQEWSTTGSTFPLAATVTGLLTANGAITAAKTSGDVITATATTSGKGIVATGAGTSVGGQFANGTAATSGTRQTAVTVSNGDIDFSGVADPSSTTAHSDKLGPMNFAKVWGRLDIAGGAGAGNFTISVRSGFNITSVARNDANSFIITFASAFANTNFMYLANVENGGASAVRFVNVQSISTTTLGLYVRDATGTAINLDALTGNLTTNVTIYGAQ